LGNRTLTCTLSVDWFFPTLARQVKRLSRIFHRGISWRSTINAGLPGSAPSSKIENSTGIIDCVVISALACGSSAEALSTRSSQAFTAASLVRLFGAPTLI
jgi:hypothetical protein